MATTIAGVAMAGGGSFVLKSMREVTLKEQTTETFSVQNEGDFCVIESLVTNQNAYYYTVNRIDDIFTSNPQRTDVKLNSIFGKNIEIIVDGNDIRCRIYEYGPAE